MVARTQRFLAACFVAALLAPVLWTAQTWADDWADLTAPTDNPETPGPDLYSNKRYEDDVQTMPDPVPMRLAPLVEALPLPASGETAPYLPAAPAERPVLCSSACRGPPRS